MTCRFRSCVLFAWTACGLLAASGGTAEPAAPLAEKIDVAPGPFQPTWDSFKQQYKCPEWFRDAKLGIWAVWGPECVPEQGDWYARRMYDPNDSAYKYHVAHYGHPSKFGFKDVIPLWKAERWDPDRLMGLYAKAGAKYFCMIAEHHDNFDCWNSQHQKWNSVNMGPKRDIAGDWQKAAKKRGLRFGMTEHLAASWWFYGPAKGADQKGPLAGVPYDGADPRYADLYWVGNEHPKESYYCPHGPTHIKRTWFDRIKDMIDRYHPDLLYSDSPLPYPDEFGRKLLAHYYNDSARRHGGRVEGVYTCKQPSQGMWVQDLERGVMDGICPAPWQTDTCVGGWYYDVNLAKRHGYKSTAMVIQMLVDIVSKNGNLLLNFPPRPDGTLDDDELKILAGMAAWMPINGEAIFGTRPWKVFGEGAGKLQGGMFNEDKLRYTAKDIRFTTKGDALYAIALGWPEDRRLTVRSLAAAAGKITGVALLGHSGDLPWSQTAEGLIVVLPEKKPCEHAFALKIRGENLQPAPLPKSEAAIQPENGGAARPKPGATAPIKAFCVDFNWGPGGPNGFAGPGHWADADPAAHVAWHEQLGANVIQTFAVSCNGYAWYKGGKVPAQPGLKHDFLTEVVKLGHEKKMRVMGYFCVAANTRWAKEHPDLSYGFPSGFHLPLGDAYLDYLAVAVEDALRRTDMDGFMVDWLWNPKDEVRAAQNKGRWLDCDKRLFETLVGKPFPADGRPAAADRQVYEHKAIERCWRRIHDTAKRVKPDCVIWISCYDVLDPTIQGSVALKEADWFMDESGNPEKMRNIAAQLGPQTQQLLCVVGWGEGHNARKILADPSNARYGIYGFMAPGPDSLPLPIARCLAQPSDRFRGNERNVAVLARFFTGRPFDYVAPPPAAPK